MNHRFPPFHTVLRANRVAALWPAARDGFVTGFTVLIERLALPIATALRSGAPRT